MKYPLPIFHFQVEWGGTSLGFTEVSGLDVETEVIEYRPGNSLNITPGKMSGMLKYSNITLKRGVFKGDNEFFEWIKSAKVGTVERRDLTISLLNEEHEPVVTWSVRNAFPAKIQSPELKSDGNEVAIESIELAHEGINMKNGPEE